MKKIKMSEKEDLLSSIQAEEIENVSIPRKLTILPLRDIVIFPYMIFPVLIGRTSTLKAVAEAVERDKFIFVTAQKNPNIDEPGFNDIYQYGTIAKIIQILRLPNNLLKVLVEGVIHAKIQKKIKNDNFLEAYISQIEVKYDETEPELMAMMRRTNELFGEYLKNNHNLPPDIFSAYENIHDPLRKLYYATANIQTKLEIKQKVLEHRDLKGQYFELATILNSEIELLKLESEIDNKVHDTIQKTQRKYYIQEQIRALQKELGEEEESIPELAAIKNAIDKSGMPEQVRKKAIEEFEKLKKTPSMSPEYSVNRTYLELLTAVPWSERTKDNLEIEHVKTILDEDHFDLEKPKERILEFIAVLNLVENLKRQILCFVGPPGVGKTSLARSIARALGRQFIRFSLGGIRDEAEIRGHRRTYIGAMPGKIVQSMKKAGTVNPVILLDEVDKMSMDFRGDPSSALLEVLDPEQNVAFNDHYLEVDYDLSNVLFITTANVRYDIPLPLQDRMEIIELNSYLEPEKMQIAKRHILPKLLKEFGMEDFKVSFEDSAILKLINEYTREAGVRSLERELSSMLRKIAKEIVEDYDLKRKPVKNPKESEIRDVLYNNTEFKKYIQKQKFVIDNKKVERYLKAPKFKSQKEDLKDKVGVSTGLAWTSVGGDVMPIEVTIMPGPQKLTLTGKLGDVMKESAVAALSYVRSNYQMLKLNENFHSKKEIHVHVPEGAIPKDGPSAGITLAIALISAASGKEVKGDVAMTGEITLRGNILPIGGLKEKLLAASRAGIKTVLIPKDNTRDIEDIPLEITKDLKIIPVAHLSEALPVVFYDWEKAPKVSNNKKK
jgi:ATP-dependent Lon protease